jgi:hypothetical protein
MTVDAIKAAIQQLPEADRRNIADWLEERAEEAWDSQMERDFSPGGRGHHLLEEVNRQIDEGKFAPMDWRAPGPKRN